MKLLKNTALLVLGALGIAIGFNNCSEAVFSSSGAEKLAPPEVILNIIASCRDAEAAGKLMTAQQSIVFEDTGIESGRPGNICEFGVGDNLSEAEGEIRARYTQTRELDLPQGAVLCDVQMNSVVQNFRYDDVFFMIFNGYLLASDNKTAIETRLTNNPLFLPMSNKNIGVYSYDWLKIRTAPFQNSHADDYCVGQSDGVSTCSWPLTEQSGNIQLDFSQEILIAMTALHSKHKLQFVITGDNNPNIDCFHKRFVLDTNVKYFIPN